jgi:putative ABC transport system substrate-binding protein
MNRRHTLLAIPAIAMLPGAWAQRMRRIALISWHEALISRRMPGGRDFLAALQELGYREGVDFVLDERLWQREEDAAEMARSLVQANPDVIVAGGPPSILAARAATTSLPIVMMYSAEPVEIGIVRSLNQPGGNITGLTWDHGFDTVVKWLELLREVLPRLRRVAVLWDGGDSVHPVYARHLERAATQQQMALLSLPVREMTQVDAAFARMRSEKTEAVIILPSGQFTLPSRVAILERGMRLRLPMLFGYVGRDAPNALMQFGPDLSGMPRRAAAYVDRILKGAKPGDIPVEQPDKYQLLIDLSVARKLGLKVPRSLLARADRVIQ